MPATFKAPGAVRVQADVALTPGNQVSIGTSSSQIVGANDNRVEVVICNDHATNVVYLSLGTPASVSAGIRLNPAGGSYASNAFTGAIHGISTGAATGVLVTEV